MSVADNRYERETAEFGRSLSFFDAVFAFSVTLLIVNLDVPPREAWQSWGTLSDALGGQLQAFAISFLVIVVFWRSNQRLIARMTHLDSATIALNLGTVGIVIFIPFSTQAMGDGPTTDLPLPTIVYAINVAAAILVQLAMWQVALSHGLVRHPPSGRQRIAELLDTLVTPVVFLLSIAVTSWLGSSAGKLSWLSLFVLSPLAGRLIRRLVSPTGSAAEQAVAS